MMRGEAGGGGGGDKTPKYMPDGRRSYTTPSLFISRREAPWVQPSSAAGWLNRAGSARKYVHRPKGLVEIYSFGM